MEELPPSSHRLPPEKPASRPRWFKRVLLVLLTGLLILVVFHRPLFFRFAHFALVRLAAEHHLGLEFQIRGGFWHDLVLENVSGKAFGPGSLQEITVGSLVIEYSFPDLIRKGKAEFLKSITVREVGVVLDPFKRTERENEELRQIKLPSVFPRQLEISGFNLVVRNPGNDLEISDAGLTLFPDRPGLLTIPKLQLPGNGRTFTNLRAETVYRERNLVLTNLEIGAEHGGRAEVRVSELNLDLSKVETGKAKLRVDSDLFGGHANLLATITRESAMSADLKLTVTGVSMESAARFFGQESVGGTLESVKARVAGNPNTPASWEGAFSIELSRPGIGGVEFDSAIARVDLGEGEARLLFAELRRGQNRVEVQGSTKLPERLVLPENARGYFAIQAPEISDIGASPSQISGSMNGSGHFELSAGRLQTVMDFSAAEILVKKLGCGSLTGQIRATRPFPVGKDETITHGMDAQVTLQMAALLAGEYEADTAVAELGLHADRLELKEGSVTRGENHLALSGTYQLPEKFDQFLSGKLGLNVDLAAPQLAAFSQKIGGALSLKGRLESENQRIGGNLSVSGTGLRFQEFNAQSVAGQIIIEENRAALRQLHIDFSEGDFADVNGEMLLADAFPYQGQIKAKLRDLSMFQPFLRTAPGNPSQEAGPEGGEPVSWRNQPIAGAVDLNWAGKGTKSSHSGNLDLKLRNGRFGSFESVEAAISGTYSGPSIQVPQFRIGSNRGSIECTIYYQGGQSGSDLVSIQNLDIRQGPLQFVTGNLFIPLDLHQWDHPVIPPNGIATVDLFSKALDLKQLSAALGQNWPVTGNVSATLRVRGAIENLKGNLQLQGRELKSAEKLAPAKLDLGLVLESNKLGLKAVLAQEEIKPLVVEGELPFNLSQIIARGGLDKDAPLKLSARLERTPLAFLAKANSEIRYAEGEMSLEARAGGSLNAPVLSGAARIDLPALRFSKPALPGVANFKSHLTFQGNQLTVDRFGGEIGGGLFGVTGKVSLAELTNPVFDLRANSQNLLIQRNNAVTIRANSNLLIQGPIKTATVSGTVGITNSRFFREVEILPIALPGRPRRPVPKVNPQLVVPAALKEWQFNVKIRTDDPFKVRSNLANGGANADLLFAGTGAKPVLTGGVEIQNFAATLPFSKMNLDYGYITFTPTSGLNPFLDLHGTSELRDYHIDIYINGTAQDPKTVMTSDPPLPQEDILALLATGATVKEIGGNPDVLAGRAAVLLFDKVYRKIFKRNAPNREEPVPNRIQFDWGGVSSTTGKQELTTQFRLTDQIYLIGEVGIEGSVGGKIKYVLRFR